MIDYRDIAASIPDIWKRFDEETMKMYMDVQDECGNEYVVAAACEYIVCKTCNGKGRYVNPSIDSNGITASEWQEWSYEERQSYKTGAYDITCTTCKGRRVTPEPLDEELRKEFYEEQEFYIEQYKTYRYETGSY